MDDLDHLLRRAHALEHFLSQAFFAHAFHKVFDDLEVDVRLQKSQPHLAQTGLHVFFGELAAPAERAEHAGKSVGKALEHEDPASAALPRHGAAATKCLSSRRNRRAKWRFIGCLRRAVKSPGAALTGVQPPSRVSPRESTVRETSHCFVRRHGRRQALCVFLLRSPGHSSGGSVRRIIDKLMRHSQWR